MTAGERAERLLEETREVMRQTGLCSAVTIGRVARILAFTILRGNKVLFCGNGGSAADAEHLAAELLVRLRPQVNRQPWPALALTMGVPTLTASANDYGFDQHFARMVEAFGKAGDLLVALSTSGRSPNVVLALQKAKALGLTTVGLLGGTGGEALQLCDHSIVVPSLVTGRIQEAHIAVGHVLCELAEDAILEADGRA